MAFLAFTNWSRRDYQHFIRLSEKFGIEDMESVSKSIDGKTPEEVIAYSRVFWQRYNELTETERIKKIVDRKKRREQLHNILNAKVCENKLILVIVT